jgi:hypothetical protein
MQLVAHLVGRARRVPRDTEKEFKLAVFEHRWLVAADARHCGVEPLFAEAKAWHGLRRFRLRRLWRVNTEALMTAAGQNPKRLLAKRGWGRRPLPSGVLALSDG